MASSSPTSRRTRKPLYYPTVVILDDVVSPTTMDDPFDVCDWKPRSAPLFYGNSAASPRKRIEDEKEEVDFSTFVVRSGERETVTGTVVRRESGGGGGSTMSMAQSVDILAHTSVYMGILLLLLSLPSPRRYINSFDPPLFVLDGLLFSYYCLVGLSLHLSVPILKKFMKLMLKTLANTNPVLSKLESCKYKEQKPLVDFDSTNNRACQSSLLVSNSDKTNAREASKGPCMTEGVPSLVDSTIRISSTDFDAPENGACLVRANQSGPIMLNSEKKHTSEGPIGECLTESVLSLDDSTKWKSFPDFDATEIKAHLVRAYQSGLVVSLSENQNRGEASKSECITKSIYGLEDLQQHCGGRPDAAAKSFRAIYDPGFHTPDSIARKSFEVLETLLARKQPNDGVPLLLTGRLTLEGCVRQEKSPDLPRVMQFNGVEQRVTKMPRYLGGLTAQSASCSCGPIGLPDGGHIVLLDVLDQSTKYIEHVATADQCSPTLSLPEKKMVRKTLNRNFRTMSVIFEEKHQRFVRRCVGATKSLGAMCISRKHGINQSTVGLPDGGHILSLLEKKIVRKTLKRKCRSMSVLSLEDHKQHVDRRWEDAAKSHGAKRICRQLVIHRLSTTKYIRKQLGIHQWPFQRSAIGLPDGGHILSLSEKKIVRKTLKRKCRSMSVLSLVDRQQHVDRRWEDAAKDIGTKCIYRQLVIHCVCIGKPVCRQHGIHHRWPFERDWATEKGYSLGDERPVEVISLSTHAELVSRLQLIYISRLGRFSPWLSALPGGGLIVGPIALSSSEFAATNNIAQHVRQDQRGSGASGSENERTREQEDPRQDQRGSGASGSENERTREQKDPKEKRKSVTIDDLLAFQGKKTREEAAEILGVSLSKVKRTWRTSGRGTWKNGGIKKVWRPPNQHGEGNTSTAREMPSHNVQTGMEGEPVGQNQEANECRRDFTGRQIALTSESGLIMVLRPPVQHGEWNTSTARETPSHDVQTGIEGVPVGQNQEANEFQRDFTLGSIPLNIENGLIIGIVKVPPFYDSYPGNYPIDYEERENAGSSFGFPPPQMTSMPSENMGGSIDLRNSLANLTFGTCSDQVAPSQQVQGQSMHPTVYPDHNVFSQTQIASSQEPFLEGPVMIKAFYRDADNTIIKFLFPLTSGIVALKKEVSKRLNVEDDRFVVKYMDKYEDLISILCDEDLKLYLSSSLGNDEINVLVHDKVGGTPNFCEKCRSSMQTRA
ncbi:hypothetical protein RHMOL_Rhmol05G0027400 [Rhododendron molle]|uniref:Uncharacterized protein n=1 Tax=Rhododendron molle TaxID=49168 RepID=A0ACC0NLY6_RHOML|nr:hypothetical protein RHMOL_Rhmol05G0027400 [Rhododendron molle]